MCRHDADASEAIALVSPAQRSSARNLVHYLALRRADLRALQAVLAKHGLSSLGRLESHAGSAVEAVLGALYALRQQPERVSWLGGVPDFTEGAQLLARHAAALFGPPPTARPVRIMVTMPSEAAGDYALVRKLLQRGMDCMRINCAHDDEAAWMLMVEHLERARLEIGRPCAVQMDLGGPKIRTGEIEPGPAVLKVKPVRDRLGAVGAARGARARGRRCRDASRRRHRRLPSPSIAYLPRRPATVCGSRTPVGAGAPCACATPRPACSWSTSIGPRTSCLGRASKAPRPSRTARSRTCRRRPGRSSSAGRRAPAASPPGPGRAAATDGAGRSSSHGGDRHHRTGDLRRPRARPPRVARRRQDRRGRARGARRRCRRGGRDGCRGREQPQGAARA